LTLCALPVNKIAPNNLLNEIQDVTLSYQTAELCTVFLTDEQYDCYARFKCDLNDVLEEMPVESERTSCRGQCFSTILHYS